MANTKSSRDAARAALDAYRAHPGSDSSVEAPSLAADLIADLAHLADEQHTTPRAASGGDVLRMARFHYDEEREEDLR